MAADDGIVCLLTDRIDAGCSRPGGRSAAVVGNAAVGYDNIDVDAARELGIAVCNTPGVLDPTTADLAFLLILAATRPTGGRKRSAGTDGGTAGASTPIWPATSTEPPSAWSATGASARAVARRAAGFDMEVLHTTRADTGLPGLRGQPGRAARHGPTSSACTCR